MNKKCLLMIFVAILCLVSSCSKEDAKMQGDLKGTEKTDAVAVWELKVVENGAVVPNPVSTTTLIKYDGTMAVSFGETSSTSKLSEQDLLLLKTSISEADLMNQKDIPVVEGQEACQGSGGITVYYKNDAVSENKFNISGGVVCNKNLIPDKINKLLSLINKLASSYKIAAPAANWELKIVNSGAVVPNPVSITTIIKSDGTVTATAGSETRTRGIHDQDMLELNTLIQEADLMYQGDVVLPEGKEPCLGSGNITMTFNKNGGVGNTFNISGAVACSDKLMPEKLYQLLSLTNKIYGYLLMF